MAKNLNHDDWVRQQFNYLRCEYRDVILHSSIIEGTLRNESGGRTFHSANDALQKSGRIDSSEFGVFDEIRDKRNQLVHDSFKNRLTQNEVANLRDDLMKKICEAYRISSFLDNTLFRKYNIVRSPKIAFMPAPT